MRSKRSFCQSHNHLLQQKRSGQQTLKKWVDVCVCVCVSERERDRERERERERGRERENSLAGN